MYFLFLIVLVRLTINVNVDKSISVTQGSTKITRYAIKMAFRRTKDYQYLLNRVPVQ